MVLIVEDNDQTSALLRRYLEASGFRTQTVSNGLAAIAQAFKQVPDLVLLDVMLPGLDGFSVCRRLRGELGVPVVLLTARTSEDDRVHGLELGADDYVVKPFSPRELVARLRAVLRRVGRGREPDRRAFYGLHADRDEVRVSVNSQLIDLTPTEFDLLWQLLSQPGRVFSRQALSECVTSERAAPSPRAIDTHVANLRRKLEVGGLVQAEIGTVYGLGYKLEPTSATKGEGESKGASPTALHR